MKKSESELLPAIVSVLVLVSLIAIVVNALTNEQYKQLTVVLASLTAVAYGVSWVTMNRKFDPYGTTLWAITAALTAVTKFGG